MSQAVITKAFTQWKAQQAVDNKAVTLDEFIFANVPGLDVTKPISNTEGIPTADKIVYRQTVGKTGVVNTNAVVYSVTLGADVGDFDFNWIGLVNKASGTLAMIIHAPTQRKVKNASGQQGNVLVRSMLMEYSGAQTATSITTPAETWQIDFTARLAGMDEADRLNALDIYGAGAFFDNGFLVAKTGTQYFVTKGLGYVGGLRASLAANQNVAVSTKPTKVWADVSYQGTLTSAFKTDIKFTVAATLADYTTNGIAHYVFALASIDANGVITDLRPKGSSQYLRRDKNLTDIADPAKALNNLNGVPKTRKINKKALSDDFDLTAADVGALPVASAVLGTTNINTLNLAKIGIYVQSAGANATVANGYPAGSQAAGVLEVIPASWTGGVMQRYTVQNTGIVWTRALNASWNGTDGPWRDWVQASTAGSVAANTALGATDLNTVGFGLSAVQAAVYHQSANASATPDRNYPEAKAGTLFVTGSAYGCQQMYITFDTCNVWMRGLSTNWNGKDGPWRPWVAVYGTNNKPTAADVGAWTAAQSAASEKALSDEIATAFKIRTNLTAADTPNTLRGSGMFGHYGVPGVAAATTAKGYPMNGFVGVIFVTWGPNATQQIAFNSNGRQFTRYATGAWNGVDGPWSAWVEVYSPNNKPTPADIGAVPAAGGNVSYLNNASHYGTKPGTWEGAGSFAAQYSNPVAPFIIPSGFGAPKGVSSYSPIIKGMIQTQGLGWATAISFGAYTTGGGNHAQACINVVGDNGVSSAWLFNPNDSSFYSPGDIKSGQYIYATKDVSGAYIASRGDIHAEINISSKGFIQSGAGVYDTPGVRCYSPNYQPTPEAVNAITRDVCSVAGFVSGNPNDAYMRNSTTNEVVILARRDWVNGNFITGQRQASAQWSGWIGNGLQVPAGCVVIGARNNGSSNASNLGLLYAAEQICINGNWVTIGLV